MSHLSEMKAEHCRSAFFVFNCRNRQQKEVTTIITTQNSGGPNSPDEIKELIVQSLDADKASDIVIIDLNKKSALADYMIIASGTSSRHVNGLARKLKEKLNINGVKDVHIEGLTQSDWVAIDAGDIMVHIFRPEVRAFYNIEKMWGTHPQLDAVGDHAQA